MQDFILVTATYVYMFLFGSVFGWVLELIFRHYFSDANPEHKWINPGFLNGPYVPLYGFGLCTLFTVSTICENLPTNDFTKYFITILIIGIMLTFIEYIGGVIFIKKMHLRLWDYSNEWKNIEGIICPKFSLFWTILGAIYVFVLHSHIFDMLYYLVKHIEYSFFVGIVFGIFIVDFCYSMEIAKRMKEFAIENELVIKYEGFKRHLRQAREENKEKVQFMLSLRTKRHISEYLHEYVQKLNDIMNK